MAAHRDGFACRQNPPTREIIPCRTYIARHHHTSGYISLVLDGSYVEAGDNGRFQARPGAVLIHHAWDAHQNLSNRRDSRILNFDLPDDWPGEACWGVVDDPDAVVRLAAGDPAEGLSELRRQFQPRVAMTRDWPDMLAQRLLDPDPVVLGDWARQNGLNPASVSRGFHRVFGVPPAAFRSHNRTKAALKALVAADDALCCVAADLGFSDQAHMTRAVTGLTGVSPRQWRRRSGPAHDGARGSQPSLRAPM